MYELRYTIYESISGKISFLFFLSLFSFLLKLNLSFFLVLVRRVVDHGVSMLFSELEERNVPHLVKQFLFPFIVLF